MTINEIIKILTYDQRVKELTVYNNLIENMNHVSREKFLITAKAEEEAIIILKEVQKLYEKTKKEDLGED